MISLNLSSIAKEIDAQLVGQDLRISEVFTDSGESVNDSLFVALVGENFDAHDFVDIAEEQGAAALLVSKSVDSKLPRLEVKDTEKALGQLARLVRRKVNPKVIGITGSAGKTSVKEMVASILKVAKGENAVLSTMGNFNNHIGVPLTLLRLKGKEQFAVIEMGANHIGEIAYCAKVAEPDVTVVNNVAPAHIEGFGSIEGVAKAKGEIYQALDSDGIGVINLDADFSYDYLAMSNFHKVTVSRHNSADFYADNIILNEKGCANFDMNFEQEKITVQLALAGEHQISNALVAAALARAVGINAKHVQLGLEQAKAVDGRLKLVKGMNGVSIIDDTYNASVSSVKAGINVLSIWKGQKILVLGNMAELGDLSQDYHQEVGLYARRKGIDQLFACGDLTAYSCEAFGDDARHFVDSSQLIKELKTFANDNTQILVKGSRSARMEQVVDALRQEATF